MHFFFKFYTGLILQELHIAVYQPSAVRLRVHTELIQMITMNNDDDDDDLIFEMCAFIIELQSQ